MPDFLLFYPYRDCMLRVDVLMHLVSVAMKFSAYSKKAKNYQKEEGKPCYRRKHDY